MSASVRSRLRRQHRLHHEAAGAGVHDADASGIGDHDLRVVRLDVDAGQLAVIDELPQRADLVLGENAKIDRLLDARNGRCVQGRLDLISGQAQRRSDGLGLGRHVDGRGRG